GRRVALAQDVQEGPAPGHTALDGGNEDDLVLERSPFGAVPDTGDDARGAIQVVAGAEALAHDERFAGDGRTPGAFHFDALGHLSSPVQAMSTQSRVPRSTVLKRCAVMVLTILA